MFGYRNSERTGPSDHGRRAERVRAHLGLQLARAFGRSPAVALLDLMELAPPLDPTGRSARMAAFLAAAFLQGLEGRTNP